MSASYGFLSNFDHLAQDWYNYKCRLNQWFIANDLNEDKDKGKVKRRAILLSALSEETYRLASNLALPRKLEEVEFDSVVKLLDEHLTPKRCGFAERFHFYAAVQRPGESHSAWAARVKGLAAHCSFKSLEEAVLDRFVMGMVAGHEKDKLFAQNLEGLTLNTAVELAESVRCAREASASALGGAGAAAGAGPAPVFSVSDGEKCSVCGYSNHKSDKCRFKAYKCKKCGKKGHLRRMCSSNKVNYVQEASVDEGDDGESVHNIRCAQGKPMSARISVNGLFLEFEIDSGSAVSVISKKMYDANFSNVPLSVTKRQLHDYTGGKISCLGIVRMPVEYEGRSRSLDVFVAAGAAPPLLGRDFICAFDLELGPAVVNYLYESNEIFAHHLVQKFPKLFSDKLGCFNKYKINLKLKPDSKPIYFKPRPVAFALKGKIDKEIDRLLTLGVLKPTEHSEFASPVVPVLKKDGGVRLCADYSVSINKQLIVEQYPLPTVHELFAKLHGGEQFAKLDLSMAYNQLVLSDDAQDITCINTHRGLFKYTRLVFGLASAPSIFQKAMECILAGIEGTVCFLDDILVSGSPSQLRSRLIAVLERLEAAGLTLQLNKCEFFKNEIQYLGHIIDKNGIRKSPEKIKAIVEAPKPSNVSELQSFLGLVNYYRSFVPDASSILSPLYNLLHKKTEWVWSVEHDQAFTNIKKILTSEQVLAHFDPRAKLVLTVDASPTGLGAILSQFCHGSVERPIAFASRTLTSAEKKYSQIQKEATAIIFGVRRFHQYLYGRAEPFILRTDHKPLLSIFSPSRGIPEVTANRLQRYAMFLAAYNYVIEYVRSADNNADYFSRAPVGATPPGATRDAEGSEPSDYEERAAYVNFVVEGSLPVTLQRLREETVKDPILSKVTHFLMTAWPRKVSDATLKPYFQCRLDLSVENGCLMRGHKVVIPSVLQDQVCNDLHSSHFGIVKMKAEARQRLWFPGIDKRLEQLAAECAVCARLRPSPPRAPLSPWPYPPRPFHRIHLDFLGPFGNQMYLIIVDAYSKWVECYNVSSSYGSRTVIEKLTDVISRFGIPHTLVSDNGTSFTSLEFANFCKLNGITHIFSPVYHPSSNGQAEGFVKIIKKGLKSIILSSSVSKVSQEKIAKFLFDYRNSKNSTTGKSPSELLFGRSLRSRLDLLNPSEVIPSSTSLTDVVERNQFSQVKNYKGKSRPNFEVNDRVWIKKYQINHKFDWIEGVITGKRGRVMYSVYLPKLNLEVKRHVDQIRRLDSDSGISASTGNADRQPDNVPDTFSSSSLVHSPPLSNDSTSNSSSLLAAVEDPSPDIGDVGERENEIETEVSPSSGPAVLEHSLPATVNNDTPSVSSGEEQGRSVHAPMSSNTRSRRQRKPVNFYKP
ncbi:uncharacterized protein K02A2.6-like [Aricia agestis]|uniref:uncharacterized protein K02A2.6-like n=1 Tax=Aricia agestis TaxID=91739 RepID=UPI001C2027F5|nr:uncharacterized protein K02A2.6-like [Aricia agestis]